MSRSRVMRFSSLNKSMSGRVDLQEEEASAMQLNREVHDAAPSDFISETCPRFAKFATTSSSSLLSNPPNSITAQHMSLGEHYQIPPPSLLHCALPNQLRTYHLTPAHGHPPHSLIHPSILNSHPPCPPKAPPPPSNPFACNPSPVYAFGTQTKLKPIPALAPCPPC